MVAKEGRGRDEQVEHGGFFVLYYTLMFDTHHHRFVMEYKIPRVIPNVIYGLWVISRLVDDNRYPSNSQH